MRFENPIALWGLFALLLPLIVLLLSKRRQEVIHFGSLEFLDVSETQTAKSIFPSEWLKFFLRVLLIFLMVLILAKVMFPQANLGHRIYVENELWLDENFDKERLADEEIHRFSFSPTDEKGVLNVQSMDVLIRKINQESDSISVYTYNFARNFVREDIAIKDNVNWIIWPAQDALSQSFELPGGDGTFLNLISGEEGLKWEVDGVATSEAEKVAKITVKIINAKGSENQRSKLASILSAYNENLPIDFDLRAEGEVNWTICIDTIPQFYVGALLEWANSSGPLKIDPLGREHYKMSGELNVENLRGSNLPVELAGILIESSFDLEGLDRRLAKAPNKIFFGDKVLEAKSSGRNHLLTMLLLLSLICERFLSHQKINL